MVREVPDGFKAFRGRVVDESDAGVEGANVYLEGRNQKVPSAISGQDGWFEMLVPLQPDVRRDMVFVCAEAFTDKAIGIYCFQMADDEIFLLPPRPRGMPLNPVTVRLLKTRLQSVRVIDKKGMPVDNAFVGLSSGTIIVSATRTIGTVFSASGDFRFESRYWQGLCAHGILWTGVRRLRPG